MGTRTVRLDAEAEHALEEIISHTGLTISAALKKGLLEYREKAKALANRRPAEFFNSFDFGEGGYTEAAARDAKQTIKAVLKRKAKNR